MRMKLAMNAITLVAFALTTALVSAQQTVQRADEEEVQVVAEKMCCKGCAQKVSGHLYAVRGVRSVGVDLSTQTLTVSLPQATAARLGSIWNATEQGDGGPTSLTTSAATYQMVRPQDDNELREAQMMRATQHVVIDNLHCQGCAQKIAAQLYAVKGVTKVSVDMPSETLIVQVDPQKPVSPWLLVDAVSTAEERPLAIRGSYGTLAITWTSEVAPKTNH